MVTSRLIDALISQVDRVNFSTKRVLTRNLIHFWASHRMLFFPFSMDSGPKCSSVCLAGT